MLLTSSLFSNFCYNNKFLGRMKQKCCLLLFFPPIVIVSFSKLAQGRLCYLSLMPDLTVVLSVLGPCEVMENIFIFGIRCCFCCCGWLHSPFPVSQYCKQHRHIPNIYSTGNIPSAIARNREEG